MSAHAKQTRGKIEPRTQVEMTSTSSSTVVAPLAASLLTYYSF